MANIVIDFETRSSCPIDYGLMNYFTAKDAKVLCLAYKIDSEPTKLWVPNKGIQQPFNPTKHTIYAHNIMFDMLAWNTLLPHFDPIPLENCIDIMALCARFTFPISLEKAAKLLNQKIYKDNTGKNLIKKLCIPPYSNDQELLRKLYKYCIQDVDAEYELLHALPAQKLSKREQKIWLSTQRTNLLGLPVDIEAAKVISKGIEIYKEERLKEVPLLTDGKIDKITQTIKLKKWVSEELCEKIPDFTKETVAALLERNDIPDEVYDILLMRKEFGRSSLAKYEKLITNEHKGRIYNNLMYYSAATGRFGGAGFQAHNLPRDAAGYDEFEHLLSMFKSGDIFFQNIISPMDAAKKMIRGLIRADEGKSILWADYSNIETRVLFWLANDYGMLRKFKDGADLYKEMASYLYNKPVEDINSKERFIGKTLILLCGYQGGGQKSYSSVSKNKDVNVTPEFMMNAVKAYRKKHKKVSNLWYAYMNAAILAVENRGATFNAGHCLFKTVADRHKREWLKIALPSGRNLYYCHPVVGRGKFSNKEVKHEGINSKTHQWSWLTLSPGRITENIDQALSRDILTYHDDVIQKRYQSILSVHDELLYELPDKEIARAKHFIEKTMAVPPFWCRDLPLQCEIKHARRYSK